MAKIMVECGIFNDPIEKQLNEQGYTLGDNAEVFQAMSDGMEALYIYGIITDRQLENIGNSYVKHLKKHIKPLKEDE